MIPTNRLRFVERGFRNRHNGKRDTEKGLQQWREPGFAEAYGEWRDVPVEREGE